MGNIFFFWLNMQRNWPINDVSCDRDQVDIGVFFMNNNGTPNPSLAQVLGGALLAEQKGH